MNKRFSLAIDGPGGAGKTTVARQVARKSDALYLDTGAMYRAVALAVLEAGCSPDDQEAALRAAGHARVRVAHVEGEQRIYLGDRDVSQEIRRSEISMAASKVSAFPGVRQILVEMQREIARGKSVVMDGRDVGTKVLPDATLKIFLTAQPEARARRRYEELLQRGANPDFQQLYDEMVQRDYNDTHRAASPLTRAEDAIEVDSTHMTLEQVVDRILSLLKERLGE